MLRPIKAMQGGLVSLVPGVKIAFAAGGEALVAAVLVAVHGVERRDNHVVDSDDPHLRGVICCFHNCSF